MSRGSGKSGQKGELSRPEVLACDRVRGGDAAKRCLKGGVIGYGVTDVVPSVRIGEESCA